MRYWRAQELLVVGVFVLFIIGIVCAAFGRTGGQNLGSQISNVMWACKEYHMTDETCKTALDKVEAQHETH